ncbi:YafY family transcriptional regulator [Ktedonosporobacter rubrisoli]|uniref:YafY family transcriptional regulator n=1 Tax=Ktedonosporobacter rubrisoli TaxID=2509675 RepID=A0A4P6JX69_KTERU|nr:YafY family protein [Ktedonosporobacter rubrisoli]QBD79993.1 YafY family transcriptional regulator [Ktedonosporobacter rubrisoli]
MYHPTTRLLTILELLQTHPQLSGEELARRLEVEPRSVRRYIQMLQDMGMPIEGTRGPGGGYRLRPGFKLPPLLFTEDEATAIVLGLLGTPWLGVDISSVAIEGALAKVYRVLPLRGRERLQAISTYQVLPVGWQEIRPEASLLVDLSEAVQSSQRVAIEYCSHHNKVTRRRVEPYGVAGHKGLWYLVAHCCLRNAPRLFRLDRIRSVELLAETFSKDASFDYQAYAFKSLATIPARWQIEVEFEAELYVVQQKIPSSHGEISVTPTGTLFRTHHDHLPTMARFLMGLNLPFIVKRPPELRDALLELAQEIIQFATASRRSIDAMPAALEADQR